MKIFEQVDPVTKRKTKTREDWIKIGVDYLVHKDKHWKQSEYAKEAGIPLSTLEKRLRMYRKEILAEYEIEKKLIVLTGNKKKDIINQFRTLLKDRSKTGLGARRKSKEWFDKTVKDAYRTRMTSRPIIGRIYAYTYDAKYKDTLPYWDQFPLIVYLGSRSTKDGGTIFHGLNLHYIAPKARQEFLEALLVNYSSTSTINSNTKLRINWNMVKSMKGSELMIKAYIPKNVKGQMKEINPKDWPSIIFLPSQNFISKGRPFSARKVWNKY